MTTIADHMTAAHRRCDEGLASAEDAVTKEQWSDAAQRWADFENSLALHLAREEKVLFPSFEQATGMTEGPTAVMRMEHDQMRDLFVRLSESVHAQNGSGFLDLSETLMVLIQQHNMKEEQMLYPMCDRSLSDTDRIISEIENITDTSG